MCTCPGVPGTVQHIHAASLPSLIDAASTAWLTATMVPSIAHDETLCLPMPAYPTDPATAPATALSLSLHRPPFPPSPCCPLFRPFSAFLPVVQAVQRLHAPSLPASAPPAFFHHSFTSFPSSSNAQPFLYLTSSCPGSPASPCGIFTKLPRPACSRT